MSLLIYFEATQAHTTPTLIFMIHTVPSLEVLKNTKLTL